MTEGLVKCRRCGKEKVPEAFNAKGAGRAGRRTICKTCEREVAYERRHALKPTSTPFELMNPDRQAEFRRAREIGRQKARANIGSAARARKAMKEIMGW